MGYKKENINDIIREIFTEKKLIKAVISNMKGNYPYTKINIKPIIVKNNFLFQFEEFKNNKAFHTNLSIEESLKKFEIIVENFNQFVFFTTKGDYQIIKKKNSFDIKFTDNCREIKSLEHNKTKNYLLEDGNPVPFLIKLGVMGENGKVFKNSYNKFRQINKYLEFIDDTIKELKNQNFISGKVKVIDFGCGKSYLTFALYHYLKYIKNMKFEIIGLDLKKDVMDYCNKVAKELNCENLEFLTGNIKDFDKMKDADIIFSLHACNNATDYAILKGLELNAKAILAVPCCQHEFNQKMSENKNSEFFSKEFPIGKHGILLEKFTSVATDAFRAQALELCGFRTQVMEFIDMEHTPKNILIRGIKDNFKMETLQKKFEEYTTFKKFLGIEPLLDTLLKPYFIIK